MSNITKTARNTIAAALLAATATAALTGAAFADDYNRVVEIINDTNTTLTHLYVSNANAEYWGADDLREQVLEPGHSITLDIDDGFGECKFDFKGKFADGDESEKFDIDVCTISTFTFYGS